MDTLIHILLGFVIWNILGVFITVLDCPDIPEYKWYQWICPLRAWLIWRDEKQYKEGK